MYIYSKNIYTPNEVVEGYLKIEDGKISAITPEIGDEQFEDYTDLMVIPGFIDVHIHGWGTGSFMSESTAQSIFEMKKNLPYEGVTSFLATSGAEPLEDIKLKMRSADKVLRTQFEDGADCLGVHLEGPFINKEFKGMQREDACIDPDLDILKDILSEGSVPRIVKLMTMAPELPNAKEVLSYCKENDIQISIGHSAATFDQIKELKSYGIGGVTHMFSGMKGLHHREPGVVGAALYFDDLMCEFAKQTGETVRHEVFNITYRLKGPKGIFMTTDCSGMAQIKKEKYHYVKGYTMIPDGEYFIIRYKDGTENRVHRKDYSQVRDLELSYIKSIRNLIDNVKPSIHDVIKMTAENPAKYIHVFDRKGSIEVGKDADLLIIDNEFNLHNTYVLGKSYKEEIVA